PWARRQASNHGKRTFQGHTGTCEEPYILYDPFRLPGPYSLLLAFPLSPVPSRLTSHFSALLPFHFSKE
ncbi:MAG: hypothetical protein CO149_07390, partial [Nitrospirae bacterium CG_4_9_14_3_um_filter_51_5]